jgi:hypothetical protein
MTENSARPANPFGTQIARSGESFGTQTSPPAHSSERQTSHSANPPGAQTARPANPSGTQTSRRSGRISLAVPILLIGSDSEGKVFSEETQTVMLSLHGAGIISRYKLIAEQELILREKSTSRETTIRVVGEIGQQGRMYTYGVAFVDETLRFWLMDFPPGPGRESPATELVLECGGCGDVVEVANGDYEYDICAIHGGLAHHCGKCGLLTVWRRTEKKKEVKETKEVKEIINEREEAAVVERAPKSLLVAEAADRRHRVRAKVNFSACVRTEVFGDDVVRCIDMSRGGVSFRSEHAYTREMVVEIAVPFSAEAREAPAIFVRGRIANVKETEGRRRCGVEFLRG